MSAGEMQISKGFPEDDLTMKRTHDEMGEPLHGRNQISSRSEKYSSREIPADFRLFLMIKTGTGSHSGITMGRYTPSFVKKSMIALGSCAGKPGELERQRTHHSIF